MAFKRPPHHPIRPDIAYHHAGNAISSSKPGDDEMSSCSTVTPPTQRKGSPHSPYDSTKAAHHQPYHLPGSTKTAQQQSNSRPGSTKAAQQQSYSLPGSTKTARQQSLGGPSVSSRTPSLAQSIGSFDPDKLAVEESRALVSICFSLVRA